VLYLPSYSGSNNNQYFFLEETTIEKKTRPGRGKPPSLTLSEAGTQGEHNPLMDKKSRNQLVPVEKTLESGLPSLTGRVNCPLCNGPCRRVTNRHKYPRADETQRGDFFNEVQNSSHRWIEPGTSSYCLGAPSN
jgi:hypothetical protein